MSEPCQVDFYLLATPDLEAERLACRLALMAWERGHRITVLAGSDQAARDLDDLMWEFPAGRFLPHSLGADPEAGHAPVLITLHDGLKEGDVVINLCPQPVPEPSRFKRLLEIVPFRKADREASRDKFRYYRERGLQPATHEISS